MKVAVASKGNHLKSEVDSVFGRCSFFLICDVDNKEVGRFSVVENIHKEQQGRAGVEAATLVAENEADSVLAGNFGPKALEVLRQLNIKAYLAKGSIEKALLDLAEKRLEEV